ncbi:MAG: type II toxin-antitoxin system prevent-host-death family antitoxin [Vulcanimicrobiota bacterium]
MEHIINIHEAKTHLSRLLIRVANGEEIIIARAGKPVARLVPVTDRLERRKPGTAEGKVIIGEDFDSPLPDDPTEFVSRQLSLNGIRALPISMSHALHYHVLPMLHRDPFDRMIIAQAQVEKLPILSADPVIARYGVEVVW